MSKETSPPAYFETIRCNSAEDWNLFKIKPHLAGPWWAMFDEVHSPSHVLSELMQNADDADAEEVSVRIEEGVFTFEHDGKDFQENDFASLCRFAYSNKRNMHTIGFRGIGFKSTFSLGAEVYLYTPTLAVKFSEERFTEPVWLNHYQNTNGNTRIRVAISDEHRQEELQNNLDDWSKCPYSLLFFDNLRRLQIGDRTVLWESLGKGPAACSEWWKPSLTSENVAERYLLVKSEAEAFPADTMQEIREERRMKTEDNDFPPSRVDIVLGAPKSVFVVLPTELTTNLPFSLNAPFIQDHARKGIKSLSTSPTNRWLLKRAGHLAAETMLSWLSNQTLSLAERAQAYDLLPDMLEPDSSLGAQVEKHVQEAFLERLADEAFILTESGSLVEAGESVVLPEDLLDVWGAETASLLDEEKRTALSRHVSLTNIKKLKERGWVSQLDKSAITRALCHHRLPLPDSWLQLLQLWRYVAENISQRQFENVQIFPVKGLARLFSANRVVRITQSLGSLVSDSDRDFVQTSLYVMDDQWLDYVQSLAVPADGNEDTDNADSAQGMSDSAQGMSKDKDRVDNLLLKVGLHKASSRTAIVSRVAQHLQAEDTSTKDVWIQLAQIAAHWQVEVPETFAYVTRDGTLKQVRDAMLVDLDDWLEGVLPEDKSLTFLHPDYTHHFTSCDGQAWHTWVTSGKAGLHLFPLPDYKKRRLEADPLRSELISLGQSDQVIHKYAHGVFYKEDWNYPSAYWEVWEAKAQEDPAFWGDLTRRMFEAFESMPSEWETCLMAQFTEASTTSTRVIGTPFTPQWILKLRELPCLPDQHGRLKLPTELYRDTPQTMPFKGTEAFLDTNVDLKTFYPLLDALGVHTEEPGPERILKYLRDFAQLETLAVRLQDEIDKFYVRLDKALETCSSQTKATIKDAFNNEDLILTQSGTWCNATGVFLYLSEDMPDIDVIRSSVNDLSLWQHVDVAERVSLERILQWLEHLPTDEPLKSDNLKRLRSFLKQYPRDIWQQCGRWLNLNSEWVAVDDLEYALADEAGVPWQSLFPAVKQRIADLRGLASDITRNAPFADLQNLASTLKLGLANIHVDHFRSEKALWLTVFAKTLQNIRVEDEAETHRLQALARQLAATKWRQGPKLEVTPYLDSEQVGDVTDMDVLWLREEQVLYVKDLSTAQLAKRVPEILGKDFARNDIRAALDYSFDRLSEVVRDYLRTNFTIVETPKADTSTPQQTATPPDASTDESSETPISNVMGDDQDDGIYHGKVGTLSEDAWDKPDGQDTVMLPDDLDDDGFDDRDLETINAHDGILEHNPTEASTPAKAHNKQRLVELFAQAQGFAKKDKHRFEDDHGNSLFRDADDAFWSMYDASGSLIFRYYPVLKCLENEPIELPGEVWHAFRNAPEHTGIILLDTQGRPRGITGSKLQALTEQHVASYRLVYNP